MAGAAVETAYTAAAAAVEYVEVLFQGGEVRPPAVSVGFQNELQVFIGIDAARAHPTGELGAGSAREQQNAGNQHQNKACVHGRAVSTETLFLVPSLSIRQLMKVDVNGNTRFVKSERDGVDGSTTPVTIVRRSMTVSGEALPGELPPLLQRIYSSRGVHSADQLRLDLRDMLPPGGLRDIEKALALLTDCFHRQCHIVVVGDYDADGATATALSVKALRALGAAQVSYLVPDRFTQGYGLSPELAVIAADRGADLILTVDNGIGSVAGVRQARALGLRVLVTDHHLPGEELPAADAIVNPNQPDDAFPSRYAAGVGVVFYLLSALRGRLRECGWFQARGLPEPSMADYLDLVALGTVADLVPLDRNNRILVEQGLRRIRAGRCCAGISALLQVAGRNRQRVVASDLGFAVGPRLNAAGRLEDMGIGIQCLLSEDPGEAMKYAGMLDGLNRERRAIENEMKAQADAMMARVSLEGARLPFGICLYDEDWHQGVIGILASRIKEHHHRPVVAMAPGDGSSVRGSARSIAGLHIRDVLAAVDSRHPSLILRFGGHAMAAGLTLDRERVDEFARAFDAEVERCLDGRAPSPRILSDGPLAADELTNDCARLIRYAGPWGQGFEEPLFDGEFQILQHRIVGEAHLKLLLTLDGRTPIDAIAFRWGDKTVPEGRVRVAYRLDLNEFRGSEEVQLMVEHLERA